MSAGNSSRIRFVAVDDQALDLMMLSELTAAYPFLQNCGTYTDVVEAAEACRYIKPDVLFLDIEMPVSTDWSCCAKSRMKSRSRFLLPHTPNLPWKGSSCRRSTMS